MNKIIQKRACEKKLFTPGPLGCSCSVKQAMLRDLGSRDVEFTSVVKNIRRELLDIAGVSPDTFTAILMQGSGTYCVESVIQTNTPRSFGRVLILANGFYGYRMEKMCQMSSILYDVLSFNEDTPVDPVEVSAYLEQRPCAYHTIIAVHCETSSGIMNPVEELGRVVRATQPEAAFVVDAMSSFGAVPLDIEAGCIDYVVSSANKCLQGVPGFAFVLSRKEHLLTCRGNARSLSLDIVDQYEGLEGNGQFRFTPPTHTLLAFQQALQEFRNEGGVEGRSRRYKNNCRILQEGMKEMGFTMLLLHSVAGYIVTSFLYPAHPNFEFEEFYQRLSELGQLIYPGKVTGANSFRIGNIGDLYPSDMEHLCKCISQVLTHMKIPVPLS